MEILKKNIRLLLFVKYCFFIVLSCIFNDGETSIKNHLVEIDLTIGECFYTGFLDDLHLQIRPRSLPFCSSVTLRVNLVPVLLRY